MSAAIPDSWHKKTVEQFVQRFHSGKLPHALLITGHRGIGKKATARRIVDAVLCDTPATNGEACRQCSACTLLNSGTHPDLIVVAPENQSTEIKIDQIRMLSEKLVLTSQRRGYSIAIIEQADAMNRFATNSLLKTLEEPTANTLIFLVTDKPSRLLPTIRSRCQYLDLYKPEAGQAIAWLQENIDANRQVLEQALSVSNGEPLTALQLLQSDGMSQRSQLINDLQALVIGKRNAVEIASAWQEQPLEQLNGWLYNILADVIRLHNGATDVQLINSDLIKSLKKLTSSLNIRQAYRLIDEVTDTSKRISTSLNVQLMLESLLSSWNLNIEQSTVN